MRLALAMIAVLVNTAEAQSQRCDRMDRMISILNGSPSNDREGVAEAVVGALAEERPPIDAELIVSLMEGESHFQPGVLDNGNVCGPMQVQPTEVGWDARDRSLACRLWSRDMRYAIRSAIDELDGSNPYMSDHDRRNLSVLLKRGVRHALIRRAGKGKAKSRWVSDRMARAQQLRCP